MLTPCSVCWGGTKRATRKHIKQCKIKGKLGIEKNNFLKYMKSITSKSRYTGNSKHIEILKFKTEYLSLIIDA